MSQLTTDKSMRTSLLTILAITLAAVLSQVFNLHHLLDLSRSEFSNGHLYQLFTAHFTHWSFDHFLYDTLTFVGLGYLCLKLQIKEIARVLLISTLLISFGFLALHPELIAYRGLSGVDSALFSLALITCIRQAYQDRNTARLKLMGFFTVGFILKTIYELTTGTAFFVADPNTTFTPLASAHLIGAMVGLVYGLIAESDAHPAMLKSHSKTEIQVQPET